MAFIQSCFFLSLFIALASLITLSATELEKSVGPVAVCGGGLRPASDIIKSCHQRCVMDPEPGDRATLKLYKVSDNLVGPSVIECAKIKQTQIFTLTWSWSYIKSPITHEMLPVTKGECEDAIKVNCPDKHCNHREPDTLEEEYHYASDTTKTKTTIALLTTPSSLMLDADQTKISPLSSKRFVLAADGAMKEDGKIYLWDSDFKLTSCPYKPVNTYGCDTYQDPDKRNYYVCSGGRFIITAPDTEETAFSGWCGGLRRSKEGFLYEKTRPSEDSHEFARLSISQQAGAAAGVDYLRHKVQQVATHLDAEICQNQCELFALEARVSSKTSTIARIGLNYYKLFQNNTVAECKTLHGCRMTSPRVYCGNPPRIGVTCTEANGLWDPTSVELGSGGVCLKPDEGEQLIVSLGSDHYVVDESLKIRINSTNHHGIYMTSFSDFHQSDMQWRVVDLDTLKPEWDRQKAAPSGLSRSTETNTTLNTPSFALGKSVLDIWNSVTGEISSVEHILGMMIISCLCLCVALVFYRVFLKKSAPRYNVITQQQPSEAGSSWI
uniref:Putative G protein n=1 Tax=Cytorhabdovirus fragariae TaxID=2676436 RepID=A0A650ACQ1_9RHAB|nr:putative G protein [Cytorhabdovirus fragariae]